MNQPDTVDEFTVTYSKVFLGLNLACISCHDGANHLEKVNVFLTGKKREDFFRQAALLRQDAADHELGERLSGQHRIHGG